MDDQKRQIILDNSSTYLRDTHVRINQNRTLMKKVAARKARIDKKPQKKGEKDNDHNNA